MDGDKTITATFIQQHILTVNIIGNGSVTPVSGIYNDGDVVTLSAIADSGWIFAGWSGDITGNTNPVQLLMDGDKTITATFIQQHTLTVNVVGNGNVTPLSGIYNDGDVVTLTATANPGWIFTGWSGDVTGNTNPLPVLMDGDKTITATFVQQHTLTVNVVGNGSVTPVSGVYNDGDIVMLTATADSGWIFAGWSGDITGNTNPIQILMDGNKTITATFVQQHTLTVNIVGNGSVSAVSGVYNDGDIITLTAVADSGWIFTGWSGDISGNTNPVQVLIDGDKTITATFIQQHTLSINIVGNGSVIPASGVYNAGDIVTLTAIADTGWVFAGWSGDFSSNSNPEQLLMDGNKTITATFIQQHTLSINVVGNGSVTPVSGIYNDGDFATLTATAAPGWIFAGWSGDISGNTNPAQVLMNSNKTITATFIQLHSLTINIVGSGSVTPVSGVYNDGDVVTLMATADSGWIFAGWSGDITGNTNPAQVLMDGDKTITATFVQQHTLTVNIVGNGSVTPVSGVYNDGDIVMLTAVADSGWTFVGWSGDLTGNTNPAQIIINSNKTITATFIQQHNLTITIVGGGSVTPVSGIYNNGDVVTLTATADPDWVFAGWSGDLISNSNPAQVTIDGDKTITATFIQQHNLSINIVGNGTVTPVGGDFNDGDVITLTATADPGWVFSGWSGDLTGNTNPSQILMDDDKTITATFIQQHTLTINVVGNGSVAPVSGIYNDGDIVTLTATADAGWVFTGWSGDLNNNINPAQILMDGDKTITATFTQQYTLTVNVVGNGSVTPVSGVYNDGDVVTLIAIADTGWIFDSWNGDVNGNTNPVVVVMNSDKTIDATFVCETVNIPDNNFEQALIDLGYDDIIDGKVAKCNIENVTNLDVSYRNIQDLTGIEYFTSLIILNCNNNNLSVLDISQNSAIEVLDCGYNQLNNLDISTNLNLIRLFSSNNNLATLNTSSNSNLEIVECNDNILTNLNLSLSSNLETLYCENNLIESLDLSNNSILKFFNCSSNNLTYLNVQNGNNIDIQFFDSTNNPDLTCIYVDDASWSEINWTNVDSSSHFVENQTECEALSINDELLNDNIVIYPNPTDSNINIITDHVIDSIVVYDLVGKVVKTLNANIKTISLKELAGGTYIIKIYIKDKVHIEKVFVK